MKSSSARFLALAGVFSSLTSFRVNACTTQDDVSVTFYGYPDNSPPGAGTAYDCGRNYIAGGTGTYDDPLTFASDPSEFTVCEVIYLPYLEKYLRFEDECAECESDWSNGIWHIDVWTGSTTTNQGDDLLNCEDALTPGAGQTLVRSPDGGLNVDDAALYDGSCHTGDTYPDQDVSTFCGSGSSSGSGQGGGTCSWAGHCAGASCSTDDDCSDVLVCDNGVCATF